jgi:hypothetical protein
LNHRMLVYLISERKNHSTGTSEANVGYGWMRTPLKSVNLNLADMLKCWFVTCSNVDQYYICSTQIILW